MSSVIIQVDLPLPSGIEIGPARRIEGREGHGKDPLSSGHFIEGGRLNRRCWQAGRQRSTPRNTCQEQVDFCGSNIEIRDHRLRIWRRGIGRTRTLLRYGRLVDN
jgi:hypothetical protein